MSSPTVSVSSGVVHGTKTSTAAETALSLRLGQTIAATVLNKTSSGQQMLSMAGRTVSAQLPVEAQPGQQLTLKVQQVNAQQIVLEIVRAEPKADAQAAGRAQQLSRLAGQLIMTRDPQAVAAALTAAKASVAQQRQADYPQPQIRHSGPAAELTAVSLLTHAAQKQPQPQRMNGGPSEPADRHPSQVQSPPASPQTDTSYAADPSVGTNSARDAVPAPTSAADSNAMAQPAQVTLPGGTLADIVIDDDTPHAATTALPENSAQITLHGKSLGPVQIHLAVTGAGLDVRVTSDTAVAPRLADNASDLTDILRRRTGRPANVTVQHRTEQQSRPVPPEGFNAYG